MELTLEEVLKGKATRIKDKDYFPTAAYVEPFIERMSKYTSDFRIQAKLPDQITKTSEGDINYDDITYNRVWVQAVMPESYRFDNHDEVVGMVPVTENGELLVISKKGMGKRSRIDDYRTQTRGGKGLITYKVSEKTGVLVGCTLVDDSKDLLIITNQGVIIRVATTEIPTLSRATTGVRLMRAKDAEIVDFAIADHVDPEAEEGEESSEISEVSDEVEAEGNNEAPAEE